MEEVRVSESSGAEDAERAKAVRRAYEELGGAADPHLAPMLHVARRLCGEYTATMREAPFEESQAPEPCKLYLLNDALVLGLDRKEVRKSRTTRPGIIDSPAFQGTVPVNRASVSRRRTPRAAKFKVIHFFDLRRVHVKTRANSPVASLRYVLRTKLANEDGTRRMVTRIASLDIDFGQTPLCEGFRQEIDACIAKLQLSKPRTLGGGGGGAMGPSNGGMRRSWSRRLSSTNMPRRRQVVSESRPRERLSDRLSASKGAAAIRVASLDRKRASGSADFVTLDGGPAEATARLSARLASFNRLPPAPEPEETPEEIVRHSAGKARRSRAGSLLAAFRRLSTQRRASRHRLQQEQQASL